MSWIRLDDNFSDHPKVLKAGPLALVAHIRALCYCSRYLTDGFIPADALGGILQAMGVENTAYLLVEQGLWSKAVGGYLIHDYLEYNPSKAEILAARKKNADHQKAHRDRKGLTKPLVIGSPSPSPINTPPNPPAAVAAPERKRKGPRRPAFQPPLLKEVEAYVAEMNLPFDAFQFYVHYKGNGWRLSGGLQMKDWKAIATEWGLRRLNGQRP